MVQDTPPKQTQPFFVSTEESYISSLTLRDTWINNFSNDVPHHRLPKTNNVERDSPTVPRPCPGGAERTLGALPSCGYPAGHQCQGEHGDVTGVLSICGNICRKLFDNME